jgi:hypothetical protein
MDTRLQKIAWIAQIGNAVVQVAIAIMIHYPGHLPWS